MKYIAWRIEVVTGLGYEVVFTDMPNCVARVVDEWLSSLNEEEYEWD
jgi:hypothetical protein